MVLTRIVADLGEATAKAFGVGARIESIAMIGSMALSSVIIPFIGQNYGANNFDRIKVVSRFTLSFALIWGGSAWVFLALISSGIAWAFTDDPEIQALIKQYFWIVPFGFGFHGISQLISASCNVLHLPFHSTAINIIRLFIFLIPIVYLGSQFWSITGFFIGIVLANLSTATIAWLWFQSSILPGALK